MSGSVSSSLVEAARALAEEAHEGQLRKSGGVPYFVHLEAVAGLLLAHGYEDPVLLSAAYLHDLIEDQPAHADRMREAMPEEVVSLVELLTEKKRDPSGQKRTKKERFLGYLRGLSADTDLARRARAISCADKIHNVMSIVEAEASGDGLLLRLSTRPGDHEGQLRALRELYAEAVTPELLARFDEATGALMATIGAWLRGRAVMLAAAAHLGQYDKAGAPYIEHPMRLYMRAESPEEKMAAVLHDVVEDSHWTLEELRREGFPEAVVRAVGLLSRGEGESYEAFIERIAVDPLARRVKLLDLRDNADLSRLASPTDEDRARAEKYRRAILRLEQEERRGS